MIRAVVLLPALFATSLFAAPLDDKDLVDRLVLDPTLKTFTKLVARAGLIETLKADGPYTIFAPNDAAFAKLPPGALDALLKDKATLRKVISFHIVPAKVLVRDFKEGALKSLNGDSLAIKLKGSLAINGAKILVPDVLASNGAIHVMPSILISIKAPSIQATGLPGKPGG